MPSIYRLTIPFLLCFLLTATLPAPAIAHGVPLRGTELPRSTTLTGTTGNCSCEHVWYTFGLRPGSVSVSAKLVRCTLSTIHECGLRFFLIRGKKDMETRAITCSNSHPGCATLQLSHRIKQRGVYYLMLEGEGSAAITYSMHIRGSMYSLHCRRYC